VDVLLINAGSSSLKLSVLSASGERRHWATADWSGIITRYQVDGSPHEEVSWRRPEPALQRALADWHKRDWDRPQLQAVAHRWVHGGPFTQSVVVDAAVRDQLSQLLDLAPLHNPRSLEALDVAMRELPEMPHIVVFDTAFHASLPEEARAYAIPRTWREHHGIQRYGFHGLSYSYCARRVPEILQQATDLRLIVCHLGQGCSAAAIHGGKCIDTTMGFTPLEGLVMATRSGSIDPGIILFLHRRVGLAIEQIELALNSESGLLGLSGISGDMREVRKAADSGHQDAQLAIQVYVRRIRQAVGALATSLGGVDAVVFTGGVGQNDARLRADVCNGLQFLGVRLDAQKNQANLRDADLAADSSSVRVLVIETREDLSMLHEVHQLLRNEKQRGTHSGLT
jgi:acetate kinase